MIPGLPWDAQWHAIAQWMDVLPEKMAEVLPNKDSFELCAAAPTRPAPAVPTASRSARGATMGALPRRLRGGVRRIRGTTLLERSEVFAN
jgi:hypothetical protein